jgi:non-heme chloroperoxidase
MQCSIKSAYDCIKAFSETDFTDDLKKMTIPTLVLQGDADQIVPIDDSGKLSAKIVPDGSLTIIPGAPHGMCTTHADTVNEHLLAFIRK